MYVHICTYPHVVSYLEINDELQILIEVNITTEGDVYINIHTYVATILSNYVAILNKNSLEHYVLHCYVKNLSLNC